MEKILDTMTRIPRSIEVLSPCVDYVCTFRNEDEPELIYTSTGDLSLKGFSAVWEMACHPQYSYKQCGTPADLSEMGLYDVFHYEQCVLL
jgi:hypothetical protein